MTEWFHNPICVPFGNTNYDTAYYASHDMDVQTAPNTPITSIVAGRVTDRSAPSWGEMVCLQLDNPVNGVHYFAYLHLAAIAPGLVVGQHINVGDLIGWSGGCTSAAQYNGTSNPTGSNFLNAPSQSSQPQTGIALMNGPVYGSGAGWATFPPVNWSLDPTPILNAARAAAPPPPPSVDYQDPALQAMWNYFCQPDYTSGIADSWRRKAKNFEFYGPPLGGEKDNTTWNGAKIRQQFFAGGWCEWHLDTTDGPIGAVWARY